MARVSSGVRVCSVRSWRSPRPRPQEATDTVRNRVRDLVVQTTAESTPGEVWLVRPDAHLAWRGPAGSAALRHWLDAALAHGTVR
jgi:hypothetical protein